MKSNTKSHKPFHFKQFSLFHHNSTMKVGTDAILLAVWCNTVNVTRVLDIGTGSGVIALILAARTEADIHAIELDEASSFEAASNFNNSVYNNRLKIFNEELSRFENESGYKYDLIVSNPPYFSGGLIPDNKSRKAAKHVVDLTHEKLCEDVCKLLDKNGKFCLVLPTNISNEFIATASVYGLYLHKKQLIFPKPNTQYNRVNMEFRHNQSASVVSEEITVRNENGSHTEEYRNYVGDYLVNI